MKKIITVLLAAVLMAAGFASCGSFTKTDYL